MNDRIRTFGLPQGMIQALALTLSLTAAFSSTLHLKDGSSLEGEIVAQNDSTLTIRTGSMGDMVIRRAKLENVGEPETADRESARLEKRSHADVDGDPSNQALFFLPTAFMPPKGSFVFRDFELFFMTLGYSPSSTTSLSAGFLFPITSEFQLLTAGLKQQLWASAENTSACPKRTGIPRANGSAIFPMGSGAKSA